jgi:general secretion pathway protein A
MPDSGTRTMYETYWRLRRPPFDNSLDPEFYFPARSHHGALLKLRYLIENRKSCGLLVGEHGLGKTYLTHVLEHLLRESRPRFLRVVFPLLSPAELLRYVGLQTGVTSPGEPATAEVVLTRLENWLRSRKPADPPPVLVVDDAHLLEPAHLQTLQFLLNLNAEAAGFTLILVGRPDLLPRVRRVAALADRVTVQTVLNALTPEEAAAYVTHRLEAAGLTDSVLQPAAVHAAWELSHGFPRSLNQVCDLSLLVGYAEGLRSLSAVEIQAAAEELTSVSTD